MGKRNSEVENAAMVQALLNGGSIDSAVQEAAMVHELIRSGKLSTESDEVEVDIDVDELLNEKPKKKKVTTEKKPKKQSTITKIGSENQQFTTQAAYIPECDFAEFKQGVKISVRYNEHELLYKEQHYPIPSREVKYNVELIKLPKEAQNAVEYSYANPTPEQIRMAKSGEIRWLKIVCYDNNIPARSRCLGYIEVRPDMKVSIKIKNSILKEQHINGDRVNKEIKNVLKDMIKFNK